jgi:hypothetical protein
MNPLPAIWGRIGACWPAANAVPEDLPVGASRQGATQRITQSLPEPIRPAHDQRIERQRYNTLIQLRKMLAALDRPGVHNLTVVLVLDRAFAGDLRPLITRRHAALRLVLAAPGGHLPGAVTLGDLRAAAGALGWSEISASRDAQESSASACSTLWPDERCWIFEPAWTNP